MVLSRRGIILQSTIIVIAVVVIIAPLAVILAMSKVSLPKSAILVPLYVYPAPGAWEPLHEAYVAIALDLRSSELTT